MKSGKKIKEALERRKENANIGRGEKVPGSQNRKKGYGTKKSGR